VIYETRNDAVLDKNVLSNLVFTFLSEAVQSTDRESRQLVGCIEDPLVSVPVYLQCHFRFYSPRREDYEVLQAPST
jgi:hypothetical protein